MPIYEYRCERCQDEFEQLVFASDTPACPACGATELKKLMSAHAVGKSQASAAPAAGGCGSCEFGAGSGRCGMS
jgi:putative FmdB family regulatory protein